VHAAAIVADLTGKAASVVVMEAAVGKDVSEHLEAGMTVGDLVPATVPVVTLDAVHKAFRRWLGSSYDLTALDAVLSAAAVEQLDGDPVWLLLISGSGNAKTETVTALAGAGAHVTSTITSEGALLSATSKREVTKTATGGLLRKIGDRGLLVIKDFTSILSMNRDSRAGVLAALREVYDGFWERNVGTDGGTTLTWTGRIVFIGAVTSAYDRATRSSPRWVTGSPWCGWTATSAGSRPAARRCATSVMRSRCELSSPPLWGTCCARSGRTWPS
jgi:hypothetical protein